MALLSDTDRHIATREFVQKVFVDLRQRADVNTMDIRAAADATDAWIDSNAASFNTALPLPFRTAATLDQKTLLFCYVALKRAGLI